MNQEAANVLEEALGTRTLLGHHTPVPSHRGQLHITGIWIQSGTQHHFQDSVRELQGNPR